MSPDITAAVALARTAFAVPARSGHLLGGGATANQCLALTDGSARRRWVLRCPQRDARPGRLGFLLGFHHAAHTRGLPVAAPHRTVDGHGWAHDAHGRPWVLLDHLHGRPLEPVTGDLAAQAAAHLAALHRLPDQLGVPAAAVGPDTRWDDWLTAPEETWQTVSELAGEHRGLLAAYRPHVQRFHQQAAPLHEIGDRVWGHGDFHGRNLLHHRGRITAILDLDGVGRRPRVTDLATGVLMLARTGSGDYRLKPGLVRAILDGYRRHTTAALTSTERAALWPAMVLSQLPDPGHLTALRRTGRDLEPALTRPLAALRDLAAQQTRLAAVFAEGALR